MELSQVQQYLKRLKLGETGFAPNAPALGRLQLAHLHSVPFENLSIHWRERMDLSFSHLHNKIVLDRRGGFCYECNALFLHLLLVLGYDARLLSAQVARNDGSYTPEFDHMLLHVQLEDPWIADVGFSDSFRSPLRITPDIVQPEEGRAYRIDAQDGRFVVCQRLDNHDWQPQFRFTLAQRSLEDFADMFAFHRDAPESHFRRGPLATIATPDGRTTLSGHKLIRTKLSGDRSDEEIAPDAYADTLLREFSIQRART